MFKLFIAFISLVLFQSVFAAPVLLTVSNPNTADVGLPNGQADGAPGRTHTNLSRDLPPGTDDVLEHFTRRGDLRSLLNYMQSGSLLEAATGAPVPKTQQLGVDHTVVPDPATARGDPIGSIIPSLKKRAPGTAGGLFDEVLSAFIDPSGKSQRRQTTGLIPDRVVNGASQALNQDSNNQQEDRRQLPPLGTLTDGVDPSQVANQNTDTSSALNPGEDQTGNALDRLTSVVKHVDADDDDQDGDDDNDDDNGEDDGGDEVDDVDDDVDDVDDADDDDEMDSVDDDVDDADDADDDVDNVDDADDDVDDGVQDGALQNGDDANSGNSDSSDNGDSDQDGGNGDRDSNADKEDNNLQRRC